MLLCIAPDTGNLGDAQYRAFLDELIRIIVLPDMQLLERGEVQLELGGQQQAFVGSIHMWLGVILPFILPVAECILAD